MKFTMCCTLLFFMVIDITIGETGLDVSPEDKPASVKQRVIESKIHYQPKVDKRHTMRSIQPCKPLRKSAKILRECHEEGKFPIKNECRIFLICLKKDVTPIFSCCPAGLHFDHLKRTCVPVAQARCFNVCQKKGARYAHPTNPIGYFQCTKLGIPEPRSCPEGNFYFDQATKKCEEDLYAADLDETFKVAFGKSSFDDDDFFYLSQGVLPSSPSSPNTKQEVPRTNNSTTSPATISATTGKNNCTKYEQIIDLDDDDSTDSEKVGKIVSSLDKVIGIWNKRDGERGKVMGKIVKIAQDADDKHIKGNSSSGGDCGEI